ncbi:hypothetical protein DITRI_Ditri01bG0025900 [Diplodiscus trichospermus]
MEFQIYGNLGDYLSFNPHPLQFLLINRRKAEIPKRIIMQTSINGYWEDVPREIKEDILERLSLSDRIRMSIVCKYWGAIALQKHIRITSQIPWLTIPHSSNSTELSFYDMSEGKIQKLKLPKRLHGMVCCGSSKGWLFMAKDCPYSLLWHKLANYCHQVIQATIPWLGHVLFQQWRIPESDIFMFNPISGEVHHLPSLFTIPCYQQFLRNKGKSHSVSRFISKIELSSANVSECIVAGAFDDGDLATPIMVAICRPGNNQWSTFTAKSNDKNFELIDFLFNKRTLYMISKVNHIETYILELVGCEVNLKLIPSLHIEAEDVDLNYRLITDEFVLVSNTYSYFYFVESTRGEMLLIKRMYDQLESPDPLVYIKTSSFYIFKMDHNTNQWQRLYNIDDQVLFVSGGGSLSLSATDFEGVEGNCIYFVDDLDYSGEDLCPILSRECGVFYLQDKRVERSFPNTGTNLPLHTRISWFTPVL